MLQDRPCRLKFAFSMEAANDARDDCVASGDSHNVKGEDNGHCNRLSSQRFEKIVGGSKRQRWQADSEHEKRMRQ